MRNLKFLIFAFLIALAACEPPHPCDAGASLMSCDKEITPRKPIGSWTVTETSSSTSVSESGSTDTFTVVLANRVPDGNVVIDFSSSDTGEVTVSPSSITFSSDNYTTTRTVTVTGINDDFDDGDITSTITISFNDAQSSDESYEALADKKISVTTIDDDTRGITVTETNGFTAPVESTTDTLDITLASKPLADVTLSVTSSDTSEITVSPSSLTFSSSNYTTAQQVTLNATQDNLIDGNTNPTKKFAVSSTADAGYAALANQVFTATVNDSLVIPDVNLVVTAGQRQNVLTWDAVSGASSYKVYRSTSSGVTTSSTLVGSPTTPTLTETSLTGRTTYYYRVLAAAGGQESALSVEKSGTPLDLPSNWATSGLSTTNNEAQQVTLTWSGVAGANNYTVYWDNVSFSDNNSRNRIENVLGSATNNVCTSGNCTYIHGGRDNGTTYYYRVAAVSPSSVVGTRSNVASGTSSSFDCSGFPNPTAQPQADNDPDLLVYYDFNADLADKKRKYNDNRYDLIGADGFELVTAGSCYSGNRAAYFSGQGYAHNDNFTDDNETALQDNFTISVWFNAAADMIDTSALMSSRFATAAGDNNVIRSFQLDSEEQTNGSKKLRYRSAIAGDVKKRTLSISGAYGLNQWHHLVFVKYDKTVELYLDNVSSTDTHNRNDNLTWSTLKVGINRTTRNNWKGYIDEFKVYGRALSAEEVSNLYENDSPLHVLDFVTAGVQQNTIAWSAYTGATSYKLYWDTSASVSTSNNLITISDNSSTSYTHSGRTAGT